MKSFLDRKLLVVVFLASQTNLFCQKSITDQKNLELLRNTKQDEVRLKLLCEISYAHSKYLPDSGIYFGNEAITLSNKLNNPALKSCAYNSLGWNYLTHFDNAKAETAFNEALLTARQIRSPKEITSARAGLCTVAFNKQDTITALAHIHETIDMLTRIPSTEGMAYLLTMRGIVSCGNTPSEGVERDLNLAIKLCEKSGTDLDHSFALIMRCGYWFRFNKMEESLKDANEALIIDEKNGNFTNLILDHEWLANVKSVGSEVEGALDHLLKAQRIAELQNREYVQTEILGFMAKLYSYIPDYSKALELSLKSLEIAKKYNSTPFIFDGLSNVGAMYANLKDSTKALNAFRELAVEATKKNDLAWQAEANRQLGATYSHFGNKTEAIKYLQRAIKTYELLSSQHDIAISMISYGSALFSASNDELIRAGIAVEDKYAIITSCYQKTLEFGRNTSNLYLQKLALDMLTDTYEAAGDPINALRTFKEFADIKDSMLNAENAASLQNLQIEYDTEKNIQKIDLLNTENELRNKEIQKQKLMRNGFILGFILVAISAWIFFKQRNRINKERQRSEELLLNILPGDVAEELKRNGIAEAKEFDKATILFTDFKGFTGVAEKLSPSELVAELNTCFKAFDHIISAKGIEKIKTIGDAYMAAGGLPDPRTSAPADVVLAALEMQQFMIKRRKELGEANKPSFEMRVGIHTGPVVAGIVGVKKFQYDIWGDTVNIASRMESSGEIGQVNISETTYLLLKDNPMFRFASRGKVMAKGKGEMEMFFVSSNEIFS